MGVISFAFSTQGTDRLEIDGFPVNRKPVIIRDYDFLYAASGAFPVGMIVIGACAGASGINARQFERTAKLLRGTVSGMIPAVLIHGKSGVQLCHEDPESQQLGTR